MEITYPRDIFGQRTGIWDDHSVAGWVGWDVYWSEVAGQRLNMGGSSAYIDHADAVGSTLMETDPAGGVQWDITRGPWGRVWQQTGTRGSAVFAGLDWQVNDPLFPSASREYNFRVYRWMTPDPGNSGAVLSAPQSWNMYSYAGNNPITDSDPSGLYCVQGSDGSWHDEGSAGETCAEAFSDKPGSVTVTGKRGNGLEALAISLALDLSSMANRATLINAQNQAMHNPFYKPGYHGSTWCNYGTCDVAEATGSPMAALTHLNGKPYPSALIVAHLAKPDSGWREVSATEAQRLANWGRAVIAAWDHHVSTIRPAGVPGDHPFGVGSHAPWVANVGWRNGVMGVNWAFPTRVVQAGGVHFYTPGY